MSKIHDKNFIEIVDKETNTRTFRIQFDFGTKTIDIRKGEKIILDYVHGGFEKAFERKGNDLIIGDDLHYCMMEKLGIGFGKEHWKISQNGSEYTITINKYQWLGSYIGYSEKVFKTETLTMSEDELVEFQSKHNITVHTGTNTLYTTWAVLPVYNPHYHMEDLADYAIANGKIILKNYFKYGENSVFVGDEALKNILTESEKLHIIDKSNSNKRNIIKDTFLSENIIGGNKADKIYSLSGDDVLTGGRADDKVILGKGNKTLIVSQGDGNDTVYNFYKAESVEFSFDDVDNVIYTKSGNNLVINRKYDDNTEQTKIADYFKNWKKNNNIIVSTNNEILSENLTQDLLSGNAHIRAITNKTTVKGTDLSDEVYSTAKNETFILGKGNDVIHYSDSNGLGIYPYLFGKDTVKLTKGSHVMLNLDKFDGNLSYERKGNDAIITSKYKIELCGCSNGKEVWHVKREAHGEFKITKTEYDFTGSGYEVNGVVTEEKWSMKDYLDFMKSTGITLKTGNNTLYTSWAVVAEPIKSYSLKDNADYGTVLGSVTLKNYFKLNEDSVYIGDDSLQDIFKSMNLSNIIDKSKMKKSQIITDTFLNETIYGTKKSDKIYSNYCDDEIVGGKGNDKIYLGEGNKVVRINKGDGVDTIQISSKNTSTSIVFDVVDSVFFGREKNNLVITRSYGSSDEKTIIKDYFISNLNNSIIVSSLEFSQKLSEDVVGLTWQIICRYPPIDNPPVEYPGNLEKMPKVVDDGHCEIICEYPPIDTVDVVDPVLQEVLAWQSKELDVIPEFPVSDSVADILLVQ